MKYDARGVSASKSDVHAAIKGLDKGLFPNAFCKILPDLVGKHEDYVNIMHADTAGTKPILSYLYWKETGDLSVWRDIIQDALVMNVDDMACVGCVQDIVLSSTIGRNKHLITAAVLSELIQGTQDFIQAMEAQGINILLSGGETADVGDVVRTLDVGFTTFARLPKREVIPINIQAGDVIVGVASYGQSSYEQKYNSGIGSNGLTSARHDVLAKYYDEKYPESFDPNTDPSYRYCGAYKLTDVIDHKEQSYEVGKLLLSPTRTYLPVIKEVVDNFRTKINGIIHCTGGAQTKVMKFVQGKRVIKDNLLTIPPVFQLIQNQAQYGMEELYSVFNMGHRLEFYIPRQVANEILDIISSFNIDAKIIGRVENSDQNELIIESELGTTTIT